MFLVCTTILVVKLGFTVALSSVHLKSSKGFVFVTQPEGRELKKPICQQDIFLLPHSAFDTSPFAACLYATKSVTTRNAYTIDTIYKRTWIYAKKQEKTDVF